MAIGLPCSPPISPPISWWHVQISQYKSGLGFVVGRGLYELWWVMPCKSLQILF